MQLAAMNPVLNQTIKPNCSIGDREFTYLLALALFLPIAAGTVFAILGAWMVLLFAGLGVAVIIAAVHYSRRRMRQFERVVLEGQRLRIEIGGAECVKKYRINAAWVKLIEHSRRLNYRLVLRAHGREIEVGRHMDIEGRRRRAAPLREKLIGGA